MTVMMMNRDLVGYTFGMMAIWGTMTVVGLIGMAFIPGWVDLFGTYFVVGFVLFVIACCFMVCSLFES